jgi:subfamily B ATP-binding cassette protein MsbA
MHVYKRILSFILPFWKHLVATIIFTFLFSALSGISIYLTIPLLNTLFLQNEVESQNSDSLPTSNSDSIIPSWIIELQQSISNSFESYVYSGTTHEVLLKISFLIIIAFFLKSIFGYLQSYYIAYIQQGMIKNIRDKCYIHIHQLPMSFFKNERTGDLISRITNDVNLIQSSTTQVFISFIREPITILVYVVIALSISVKLFLFSIIILPISAFIIGIISGFLRKQSIILQKKMGNITTILQETIVGVKIVKAFGMENYEIDKFRDETNNFFRTVIKKSRIQNISSPTTEFAAVIVGVIIIYYGGLLVLVDHTLKASNFMGFLFTIFQIIPPMKQMANVNNHIQESIAAGTRVFEILDIEPSIKNIESPKSVVDFYEKLEFKNVSFKYDNSDREILDNIDLTAKKGEIIAFVGSSGAGKTTIVDLIPRFHDPISGEILLDGINIKEIKIEDLRKLMGIVTQETILFNETVSKNIAYGLSNIPQERIEQAAKIANAHNFILELPNAYDTIIGERGAKLSGGQRQRISIARALLKNPPIMIFDEATSALDSESEVLVQEAIENLMKERTTFIIAHRLSTIRKSDRIYVLDKGKIVQVGKHEELLNEKDGIYNKLYQLQFSSQQSE